MKIYYIEYKNSIKFFQNEKTFELIKNEKNFGEFQKILNSKKYKFISLI